MIIGRAALRPPQPRPPTRSPDRAGLRSRCTALVAVAMAVQNVTTYGFTIVAARVLGPVEYGALAGVMGLLLVLNVLSLGLQATGARRISAAPEHVAAIEADVMMTYRGYAGLGVVALVCSPVRSSRRCCASTLNLAALIAVTVVPLTIMGGQAGILQGERRVVAAGRDLPRRGRALAAFGAVALTLEPDTSAAMLGVALGAFAPVIVGWWPCATTASRTVRPGPAAAPTNRRGCCTSRSTTPTPCWPSSRCPTSTSSSPATCSTTTGRPLRRRADPHQGRAVPAAVRGGRRLPDDGERRRPRAGEPDGLASWSRRSGWPPCSVAAAAGARRIFVGGSEYAEIGDLLWAFALLGTVLVDAPAAGLHRARPRGSGSTPWPGSW